jgi:hypothetical protein
LGQLEACGARDAGVEQPGSKLAMAPNRRLNRFFLAGNFASIEAPNTYKSSQIHKDSSRDRGEKHGKTEDLTKRNTWNPKNSGHVDPWRTPG